MSEESSSSRWTCEACGCNTNTEQDDATSCGVCGTRREPALLRHRAYRLLHEGLVHRHLSVAAGGGVYDEDDNDEIVFGAEDGDNDDDDDGMNYEIQESRMVDRATGANQAGGTDADSAIPLQRIGREMGSAAAISSLLYGNGGEEAQLSEEAGQLRGIDHSSVLATATENASAYQPQWASTVASSGRRPGGVPGGANSRSGGGGIVVDADLHPNVAYLPEGGDEGKAVRAFPPLPRIRTGSSQSRGHSHRTTRSSSLAARGQVAEVGNESRCRQVGFKVAFDHPSRSDGRGMGGCYLVGVTTAAPVSSSPLAERHGLEESGVFWGVEDGGRRYEGRTGTTALNSSAVSAQIRNDPSSGSAASELRRGGRLGRGRVPSLGPSSGVQMSMNEAPRNSDNVLYSSREVVTIVADLDLRTLTYWRDGHLLGTLVRNLPRTGSLYPVVVPFNTGVSVAITGLDGDPLSVLSDFRATQRRSQQESDEMRRLALSDQRAKLMCDGQLSQEMISILRTIFSWYRTRGTEEAKTSPSPMKLGAIPAARLWYRCGLRLSHLQVLLDSSLECLDGSIEPYITADDFVGLVAKLVKEDDDNMKAAKNFSTEGGVAQSSPSLMLSNRRHPIGATSSSSSTHTFEVGDMVEVVEDYERIGDAASGPLRPGERGTVMEVQQGPRGSRPSIRVIHNGRRWWYQPQALVSERSGLVESPVARLLRSILRSHGYDHATLKPLWGQRVTADSWHIDDLVVPARLPRGQDERKRPIIGRIIADSSQPPTSPSGKDSTYVTVEFADPIFGKAVGALGSSAMSPGSSLMFVRRVRVHNLVHTTFYHMTKVVKAPSTTSAFAAAQMQSVEERQSMEPDSDDQCQDCYIDDCSEAGDSESMMIEAPDFVNGLLKSSIAQISTLSSSAMSDVSKECRRSKASLACMFGAGLPEAITSALDHVEDRVDVAIAKGRSTSGISASSLSALGSLAVLVSKALFADDGAELANGSARRAELNEIFPRNSAATISARPQTRSRENSSSPPNRSDATFSRPSQYQSPTNAQNLSQQNSSVRDLIRDLSTAASSSEQRRSLLFALMSRARMANDESQNLPDSAASSTSNAREMDYHGLVAAMQQSRSGQPFSFEAPNAPESVPFGMELANPSFRSRQQLPSGDYAPSNHSALLDSLSSMLNSRSGGNQRSGSGSARATGEEQYHLNASRNAPSGERRPSASQSQRPDGSMNSGMNQRGSSVQGRAATSTLLEAVLRKKFSVRPPTTMRRCNTAAINAQARSLINNGLLLNNLQWVQKSLGTSGNSEHTYSPSPSSMDLMTVQDDDEATPLVLAIRLGCPTVLVDTLIKAGAVVGEQEVQEAALSNQPETLSLLLSHSTYTVGSVDLSVCSAEVIKVLDDASERQKRQEETMFKIAGDFVSTLIRKTVNLALKFRLLGRKLGDFPECNAFAQSLSDALVGKVLLYAIHKSQSENLCAKAKESGGQQYISSSIAGSSGSTTATAEDGRMPAFSSEDENDPDSGHAPGINDRNGVVKSDSCLPLSLLRVIPASCFIDALAKNVAQQKAPHDKGMPERSSLASKHDRSLQSPCLRSYLRLAESYLWSKKVGDAAIGLSLVCILLEKSKLLWGTEVARYGIKDLAESHYKLAEDMSSEICSSHLWAASDIGSPEAPNKMAPRVDTAGVVLCPKRHTSVVHLTRHSSFRCDICGKGVDQGQPMHGCRECDWDACEKCTDKAEGGFVKWRHVRDLALEVQHLLSICEGDHGASAEDIDAGGYLDGRVDNYSFSNEELLLLSQNIRQRNCASVQQLQSMLQTPGRVTIYEFSSFILPSLHDALVNDCNHGSEMERLGLTAQTPSRRSKKPRVSDGRRGNWKNTSLGTAVAGETDSENDFNRAVVETLILSTSDCAREFAADSLAASEETMGVMSSRDFNQVNDDTNNDDNDDDDDDDDESDDESDDLHTRKSPTQGAKSAVIPELLQLLHSTMAFHERAPVRKHKLRKPTSTSSSAGCACELQSLTLPFEIELLPSQKGSERGQSEGQPFGKDPPWQRHTPGNIVTVHVEPLMPMAELQLHVLRTCRICEPEYLRFCRRLVLDRAIIAEKPAKADDLNTEKMAPCSNVIRRIAQIVAFDEATGAHAVRYASRFVLDNNVEGAEGDIFDQLEFQGREILLVLASRDYYILHRDENSVNDSNVVLHGANPGTCHELPDVEEILRTEAFALQNNMRLSSVQSPYAFQSGRRTKENEHGRPTLLPEGTRVESNVDSPDGSWFPCTIISSEIEINCSGTENLYFGNAQSISNLGALPPQERPKYSLVTDCGEVKVGVFSQNIRGHNTLLQQLYSRMQRDIRAMQEGESGRFRGGSHAMYGRTPAASVRRGASSRSHDASFSENNAERSGHSSTPSVGVLKRTWSALSPIEKMCSLDLCIPREDDEYPGETTPTSLKCRGDEFEIDVDVGNMEKMPLLAVDFSIYESRPTVYLPPMEEDTVFGGLRQLSGKDNVILQKISMYRKCRLYFTVRMEVAMQKEGGGLPSSYSPPCARQNSPWDGAMSEDPESDNATLHHIATSLGSNQSSSARDETTMYAEKSRCTRKRKAELLFEGLGMTCIQCMELLSCLANDLSDYHRDMLIPSSKTPKAETEKMPDLQDLLSMFESDELTKKLLDQLEDPLAVVGGALPDWCIAVPSFCPRIFSHSARRLLLERAAFGVSRSALRQQDAKVAVGPLRQRMAALRGRAVELVGEAFSGGAADPTALQLQADELYGMEEALAARVKAAFRTQSWEECSLQCAKAAVRRHALLKDAAAVMKKYCSDASARRRRLEVRFEGESGFDAASGNQAGVTRGFYADVAEALLSTDHVSSVHCPPICPSGTIEVARAKSPSNFPLRARKLPLWIPDLDASHKVVIPTPRADSRSHLGVFPRPLSSNHPQHREVLVEFRFMGRLFAAALRDGFVFPLPLSTSFLKLVQVCSFDPSFASMPAPSSPVLQSNMSMDELSNSPSKMETLTPNYSRRSFTGTSSGVVNEANDSVFHSYGSFKGEFVLSSQDLPRPGFLGGEVYAVESHICPALDKLDNEEPALSREELRRRRDEIASEKSFARRALGKPYDCSFEDYFEDRTFVDPFDPAQGEDAFPLCPNGHLRSVTIDNVREWVILAKQFILGGVKAQALAFRHGVSDFFSADALGLFTAEELQRDVCGGGDNVDNWDENAIRALFKLDGGKGAAEALVAVAAMGGEGGAALSRRFGPSSPTIGYLVKALLEATPTQRRQFLSFVTSVPIVTPGAIEVVPVVNPSGDFLPMHDPSCLPRANTCARRLYLPKFENYACFVKVLWAVVQEECHFKGFFEWRG